MPQSKEKAGGQSAMIPASVPMLKSSRDPSATVGMTARRPFSNLLKAGSAGSRGGSRWAAKSAQPGMAVPPSEEKAGRAFR
jgi:hypothetical protein